MNPKIYIIDPHIDPFFSIPLSMIGENFNAKYKFILEEKNWSYYLAVENIFFINTKKNSITDQLKDWRKVNKLSSRILFKEMNKIEFNKNDILFISTPMLISIWQNNSKDLIEISSKLNLVIIINHYLWKVDELSKIFNHLESSFLLCERSPLVYSEYLERNEIIALKKHKIIEIPYIPNQELIKCRSKKKINKCAIIGQTHKLWNNHLFYKKTGFKYFHKLRNKLRKKYLRNTINKKIFSYYGPTIKIEINVIIDKLVNNYFLKRLLISLKLYNFIKYKNKQLQKYEISKYYRETRPFKEIFKEYSIVLCGEEDILNLPVLGFFEAMMAGSVPLGSLHNYYQKLGMQKNIHYLSFDGTYEDAELQINTLFANPKKVKSLIKQSTKFIDNELSPKALVGKILHTINKFI